MRNALAAGAAVVAATAIVYSLSAAATFGPDGGGSSGDIPGPLWLLFACCAVALGCCVFHVLRRR